MSKNVHSVHTTSYNILHVYLYYFMMKTNGLCKKVNLKFHCHGFCDKVRLTILIIYSTSWNSSWKLTLGYIKNKLEIGLYTFLLYLQNVSYKSFSLAFSCLKFPNYLLLCVSELKTFLWTLRCSFKLKICRGFEVFIFEIPW